MKIDKVIIRERLQELAGNLNVKVTLNKHLKKPPRPSRAVSARVTDEGYAFNFNPGKIRSEKTLESKVQFCVDTIGVI